MRIPFASLAAVILVCAAAQANAACTTLSADLSQGSQNASVTALQNYLVASGYLSAKPTGYFGPATFAAVKKYQSAHGISATGYAGPLTRASIHTTSCVALQTSTQATTPVTAPVVTTTPVTTTTVSTPVSTIHAPPTPSIAGIVVTAPSANETLTSGKTYTITWNGKSDGTYNILLEDANGVGKGYIASNVYHANTYTWNVGNVSTSVGDGTWNPPLPTGTYRIHVVDAFSGAQTSDVPSAAFSLVSIPLSITSISPSYVTSNQSAANPTTITMYGSGFDRTTSITLQGAFTSTITPTFIYPGGTELVFTVPSGLATGRYGVGLSNIYGSFSSSAVTLNISN